MKSKPLPTQQDLHALLYYNPDTGEFRWKRRIGDDKPTRIFNRLYAGKIAGNIISPGGYKQIRIHGVRYKSHRLAWAYAYGYDPGDLEIDHRNRLPGDNRLINLRTVSRSQNMMNARAHLTFKGRLKASKYKGVSTHGKRWRANIGYQGQSFYLGCYDTPEIASFVYQQAAAELHGDYAFKESP